LHTLNLKTVGQPFNHKSDVSIHWERNLCCKTKKFASKDTFFIKLIFTDNYYNECNISQMGSFMNFHQQQLFYTTQQMYIIIILILS